MSSIAITREGSLINVTLLIAGCCIGAGMIGMPVITALAGFLPASLAMVVCYIFATGSGLLILESTLWFENEVNLITMANFALGKIGKAVTWILFAFLFYCIFVAYIDGGGQLFTKVLSSLLQYPVAREIGILSCVGFIGAIVYFGTAAVSRASHLFLAGLAASFLALIALGLPHVKHEQLLHIDWKAAISAMPVLLVCFGYQNLVPTLTYYAKRNLTTLRTAIFVGNLIPLAIYTLWNYVILGILPNANSAEFVKIIGQSDLVTELLEKTSKSESVMFFAMTFSFFAILTPFMAITLSFVDFLKDGLKLPNAPKYKALTYSLVLVPPTLVTFYYPHLFLRALGFAGGFADVLLFGILPVLIIWVGRYVKGSQGPYRVAGGKIFLGMMLLLSVGVLFIKT